MTDFHRRPLPTDLVPFSSDEGRRLFREALDAGTAEAWFALSEQFHTQADPATCGLGSLVVVLNALDIDPGRTWKGPWRWFSEDQLDCCVSLDVVRERGTSLGQIACLARCNGAEATLRRAMEVDLDAFRADLAAAAGARSGPFLVAAYDRQGLGQTGGGHFSPLAAWHAGTDQVLVLDVARFKYPPHWVPVSRLFAAMATIDPDTGRSRGWVALGRSPEPTPLLLRLGIGRMGAAGAGAELARLRGLAREDADAAVSALLASEAMTARVSLGDDALAPLVAALEATDAFRRVSARVPADRSHGAALLVLALDDAAVAGPLGAELAAIRRQLDELCPPPA